MARKARQKSRSGIYTVMLRGKKIFGADDDYDAFVTKMTEYFGTNAKVYAYSLMEKAVCLIIKESKKGISADMKPFVISYARYYNSVHKAKGRVFNGRFKSEPLTTDDLAEKVAAIHKLYMLIGEDASDSETEYKGVTGVCDVKEALKIMGGRSKYTAAMKKDHVIPDFYKVLVGERAASVTAAKKATKATKAVKQTTKKAATAQRPAAKPLKKVVKKTAEVGKKAEKVVAEEKKPAKSGVNKKNGGRNMPSYLL